MHSVFDCVRRNRSKPPAALRPRLITIGFLMLTSLSLTTAVQAGPPAPPSVPSSQRLADVEQQLAQARKRLDEAALELSRLHETLEVSAHKKGGSRAMLGVLIDDPDHPNGVFIAGVTPGGGAAAAGLRSGDVLTAIDGERMDGSKGHPHSHISLIMQGVTPGNSVDVRYLRNGAEAQTKVVTQASGYYAASLADMEHSGSLKQRIEIDMDCFQPDALLEELSDSLGISFDDSDAAATHSLDAQKAPYLIDLNEDLARYFDTKDGVLVVRRPQGNSSLKAGDVLNEVAGKPVTDVQQALALLQLGDADKPIKLQVIREGKIKQVSVAPSLLIATDTRVIRISSDEGEMRIELSRTPTGRMNLAP